MGLVDLYVKTFILSFVVALLGVLAWPLAPARSAATYEIAITALGEHGPDAKGSEVWISGLPKEIDGSLLITSSEPAGVWKQRDALIYAATVSPATVRWAGTLPEDAVLSFSPHAWSGKVRVEINGEVTDLDLYAPEPAPEVSVRVSDHHRNGGDFILSPEFLVILAALTVGVFAILVAFTLLPPAASENRAAGWLASVALAVPSMVVFGIALACVWPGAMSSDSIGQWDEVHTGSWTNAHPLLHTLFVGLPGLAFGTPGAAMVIQIVLFALAVGAVCAEMIRWGAKRYVVWTAAVVIPLFPSLPFLATTYWKDITYSIAILFLSTCMLAMARTRGAIARRLSFILLTALALFFTATMRHNGIVIGLGAPLVLAIVFLRTAGVFALGSWLAAGFVLPLAISMLVYPALGVRPLGPHYGGIVPMHVLAAMDQAQRVDDPLLKAEMLKILPQEEWTKAYDCTSVLPLFWNSKINYSASGTHLVAPTIGLMLRNPDVAIKHIFCVNSIAWRLTVPPGTYPVNTVVGIHQFPEPRSEWYPVSQPLIPGGLELAERVLDWSAQREINYALFWRPAAISLFVIALAGLVLVTRGPAIVLIAFVPVILNMISLVPVIGSQDYRYMLPTVMVGLPMIFLLGSVLRRRDTIASTPVPTTPPPKHKDEPDFCPELPDGLAATWVVMPAYNEGGAIGDTLKRVKSVFPNIVVVDDCSTDTTGAIATGLGAIVARHPINLGQGAALQTGIDYALSRGATEIVTLDSDGQHDPADAARMLAILKKRGVDIVLGSRFLGSAEGISGGKRLFLKAATAYTSLSTGLSLTDTHNGLRAMTRAAAQKIRIRQNRMAHASEILDQIAEHKLSYVEAPVTITYTDYSKAKGQRMSGAFSILFDQFVGKLYR